MLKRRVHRWRIMAILALGFLAVYAFGQFHTIVGEPYIARVSIYGIMTSSVEHEDRLAALKNNEHVKAVIVTIDSPGGSFVGGESIYRTLLHISEEKPVAAVFGDVGTSAAYMAALGADRIFARDGTLTASIGVIMQTADIVDLLDSLGVRSEVFKSGQFKASPNPLEHTSQEVRHYVRDMIDRSFHLFLDMVKQRRGLSEDRLAMIVDGRVMIGRTAYENGLVDEIGSQREAVAWIESRPGMPRHLPVVDVPLDPPRSTFFLDSARGFLNMLFAVLEDKVMSSPSRRGLISVWNPAQGG